jgi:hypothetical protein
MAEITLEQLIAAVPALRDAGVVRLRVGDVEVQLREPEPTPAAAHESAPERAPIHPLDDPATFGRRNGGVPSFRRHEE